MKANILIIDDEPKIVGILKHALDKEGYNTMVTTSAVEGVQWLKSQPLDIILCDLKMPEMTGIEVLEQAKRAQPQADFIIITAYATVETAVEAMKKGAFDYIMKPLKLDELRSLIKRLLETKELKEVDLAVKKVIEERLDFANFIAVSKEMQGVLKKVAKVAGSESTVLIQGESGTGKEILANIIHNNSPRKDKPLIRVNCGAIPETLLESELFGYVKGAFTGATETRKGLFQIGDKGTIFLDEVGELSPALQVKLLRVLQDGELQRVGDYSHAIKVDVRIIAATNRDLEKAVKEGQFRRDLYYRLSVVPIHVPPLRERQEDIPALVDHFISRFGAPSAKDIKLSDQAYEVLLNYSWPGNVRELENAIEHAMVMRETDQITIEDFPISLQNFYRRKDSPEQAPDLDRLTLEDMEKRAIMNALEKTSYNYTRAARILGVTRRTLGYRIKKYGLEDKIKARKGKEGNET